MDRIIATRGRKVVEIELSQRPTDAELLAVLLGPTGNLRAPALRAGGVLVVGFEPVAYRQCLD